MDDSEISGGAVYTPLYHAGSTVEKVELFVVFLFVITVAELYP